MEDEVFGEPSGSGNKTNSGNLITLFLVLTALFLGGIGVYMAQTTRKEFQEFREAVQSKPDTTAELRDDLVELDARLIKVGGETVKNREQARSIIAQTQRAFDDVTQEVRTNREQLSVTNERLSKLATGGAPVAAAAVSTPRGTAPVPAPTGADGGGAVAPDGHHTIVGGDTFDKLARKYGKPVDAFITANPGVDPLRLQIGQRIRVPD
jgi:LysM repeat protein